jgi:hypothetical protein
MGLQETIKELNAKAQVTTFNGEDILKVSDEKNELSGYTRAFLESDQLALNIKIGNVRQVTTKFTDETIVQARSEMGSTAGGASKSPLLTSVAAPNNEDAHSASAVVRAATDRMLSST